MKGLTMQERRVLIAIMLALVIGAAVRYWRRQGEVGISSRSGARQPEILSVGNIEQEVGISNIEQGTAE